MQVSGIYLFLLLHFRTLSSHVHSLSSKYHFGTSRYFTTKTCSSCRLLRRSSPTVRRRSQDWERGSQATVFFGTKRVWHFLFVVFFLCCFECFLAVGVLPYLRRWSATVAVQSASQKKKTNSTTIIEEPFYLLYLASFISRSCLPAHSGL